MTVEHGAEVGPARVGVTNALHYCYLAFVVEIFQGPGVRMKSYSVVQRQDCVIRYLDVWPGIMVFATRIGNNGVHEVVAP
jgi:hypothetical protein